MSVSATGALRRHILYDALDKRDISLVPRLPLRAGLISTYVAGDILQLHKGHIVDANKVTKALQGLGKDVPTDTVIGRFWHDPKNKGVVDAFMNNKLCIDAAKGKPDALSAFKKYSVQDYFYLLDWVTFKALRFTTVPHDDFDLSGVDKELASLAGTTTYVKEWFSTCAEPEPEGLGITSEEFKVERTIGEIAYARFLQDNARTSDWYSLHVVLVGCYWAWGQLALKLYNDSTTDTSTVFYKYWIQANLDLTDPKKPDITQSAKDLSTFLDANAAIWSSTESNHLNENLFRTSLRLEVGLFDSAYDTPTPREQL